MTSAFDPRIVRVGLNISGKFLFFDDLDIRVQGQKCASPTNSFCVVKISNLTRDQRHEILTKASPVVKSGQDRTPTFITVDVGRESYGTFRLFEGTCYTSTVTSPPDISIMLRSLAQSEFTGLIQQNSQGEITQLRTIAQSIASQNNLILDFQATPKQIANYSFTGSVLRQLQNLQEVGNIRAFIDGKTLIVLDQKQFRSASNFVLNVESGMVGIPQSTESGCTAQMLINPEIKVGNRITIDSKINPSVNGSDYAISQINFDIANRDDPFFYNLVCSNYALYQGTIG